MKARYFCSGFMIALLVVLSCNKDQNGNGNSIGKLQLISVKIGGNTLNLQGTNKNLPVDQSILITFNNSIDSTTVKQNIILKNPDSTQVHINYSYTNNYTNIVISPTQLLQNATNYSLQINSGLKGIHGEIFPKITYVFTTVNGTFTINNITLNGKSFTSPTELQNIDPKKINISVSFSQPLNPSNYQTFLTFSANAGFTYSLSADNKNLTISNTINLQGFTRYYFTISSNLTANNGFSFMGFSNSFYTAVDSTPKFPLLSDDALMTLVQQQTFNYFWNFGHPSCGMARERNTSGDVVTTGGSGFGVMSLIVGMNRGFITRTEGLTRLTTILGFLETCDRFHGAWPHWLNGTTGKVVPFSTNDDGADLVETSYMIEGLLTMRQYLDSTVSTEKSLINRIDTLNSAVEYDWFTQGQNVLYWNWSPDFGWAVNVKIQGYNETLITYILAASSPKHPISNEVYQMGYAQNGSILNGNTYYGYVLPLGEPMGGPLFFTQYSYLGLDPRNLSDKYANYWLQNVNQSLINWAYCVANPKNFVGYSTNSWGLTASDNPTGYAAQSPTNDLGVITPTAAISAIPYCPAQSLQAMRYFYYTLGDKLWGQYGFYDAYDVTDGWWATSDLAIDEGPMILMIENYRSQLLWNLFMSCPEVQNGLMRLGFTY